MSGGIIKIRWLPINSTFFGRSNASISVYAKQNTALIPYIIDCTNIVNNFAAVAVLRPTSTAVVLVGRVFVLYIKSQKISAFHVFGHFKRPKTLMSEIFRGLNYPVLETFCSIEKPQQNIT